MVILLRGQTIVTTESGTVSGGAGFRTAPIPADAGYREDGGIQGADRKGGPQYPRRLQDANLSARPQDLHLRRAQRRDGHPPERADDCHYRIRNGCGKSGAKHGRWRDGIFTGHPRSANVTTTVESSVLEIHRDEFYPLLEESWRMHVKVLQNVVDLLSHRLIETGHRVEDYAAKVQMLEEAADASGESKDDESKEAE